MEKCFYKSKWRNKEWNSFILVPFFINFLLPCHLVLLPYSISRFLTWNFFLLTGFLRHVWLFLKPFSFNCNKKIDLCFNWNEIKIHFWTVLIFFYWISLKIVHFMNILIFNALRNVFHSWIFNVIFTLDRLFLMQFLCGN